MVENPIRYDDVYFVSVFTGLHNRIWSFENVVCRDDKKHRGEDLTRPYVTRDIFKFTVCEFTK